MMCFTKISIVHIFPSKLVQYAIEERVCAYLGGDLLIDDLQGQL